MAVDIDTQALPLIRIRYRSKPTSDEFASYLHELESLKAYQGPIAGIIDYRELQSVPLEVANMAQNWVSEHYGYFQSRVIALAFIYQWPMMRYLLETRLGQMELSCPFLITNNYQEGEAFVNQHLEGGVGD